MHFNEHSLGDEDKEDAFIASIFFEEMVAQANAQSDHYSAEKDSEDEWDQYGGRYEDHVAEEHEEQESGVLSFGAFSA